jgi:hypothetical protein
MVAFLTLAALVLAPWLPLASTSGQSTLLPSARPSPLAALPSPVYSDFDGDHQPDQAELFWVGAHKDIHLSLSSSSDTNLPFDSLTADWGSLLALDIDQDNDLDLIWISQDKFQPPVVWINDGRGRFERDTGSHAAELKGALRGDAETSLSHSQKVSYSLGAPASPFSSDPAQGSQPEICEQFRSSFRGIYCSHNQSICLTYLRKRGPPSSHS